MTQRHRARACLGDRCGGVDHGSECDRDAAVPLRSPSCTGAPAGRNRPRVCRSRDRGGYGAALRAWPAPFQQHHFQRESGCGANQGRSPMPRGKKELAEQIIPKLREMTLTDEPYPSRW